MRERLAIGAAILTLTVLSYFQFPGHTYLGSDTEIYVPMLEHIWDPSALIRDLVATKPHLSYTLYDEVAIALRWLTRSSFEAVLTGQQLVFRALQILGVYLLALSTPMARRMALLVAALFTLGATIAGPAVLTFEYEPVPRGFAIALVFLAIGLAAQEHLLAADIAAALAFLYHPPTVAPFWALYLALTLRRRDFRDLWPLAIGIALLVGSSFVQPGGTNAQVFLSRVSPELEKLQRMRASYNWVSTWPARFLWHYAFLWSISLVAFWRIRPKGGRLFLLGLPLLGILSVPVSYLLLEKLKWMLIPQFQPARAVLFVTAFAVILGAVAGVRAAQSARWIESTLWFGLVFAVPMAMPVFSITTERLLLAAALAGALTGVIYLQRFRWSSPLLAGIGVVPFFLIPAAGHVRNYPDFNRPAIEKLADFARSNTPKDAVFLFADASQSPTPSIFRALACRAVYVDWKAGGQGNYNERIAMEWWQRWQETNELRFDPSAVERVAGIDYLVLSARNHLDGRQPAYADDHFNLYRLD